MGITDAQLHIWGAETPERPWPEGHNRAQREEPYTASEVIAEMDAAGVDRAVIVPPSWEGDRNDLALEAVRDFPGRFGVMGRVDLREPSEVDLDHWREQPGMLGVRLTFNRPHQRVWLEDSTIEWFWSQAEEAGVPVMVFAPGLTDLFAPIAIRHPGLRLIIDHVNLSTDTTADVFEARIEPIYALAKVDNIAIKVSALPCCVDEPYPFTSLHPHIRRLTSTFGPERCLWGSDLSRLPCPYIDWVRAITDAADYLSPTDKALIMGGSTATWLDWPENN